MKTRTKQLLDMAVEQAMSRLEEYTPADLNALIKALSTPEKPEVETPQKKLSGFITNNLTKSGY